MVQMIKPILRLKDMSIEYNKIRPQNKRTRFYVDNEILEVYGPILKPHGIALYCALAKHANSKTQECFPSYETLQIQTGIGRRNTIRKYQKLLIEHKLIEIFHKKGRRVNYYRLLNCNDINHEHSIQKDTNLIDNQNYTSISKENTSYPIRHISSSLGDTLNHIKKSYKEISTNKEDEVQSTDEIRAQLEAKGILRRRRPLSNDKNI